MRSSAVSFAMMFRLSMLGFVALFVFAIMASQAVDISTNYAKVPAIITSAKRDCFIEGYRSKIVIKGTSNLAYLDCAEAQVVAQHEGYSASNVHTRAQFTYDYVSPADGKQYQGTYERTDPSPSLDYGYQTSVYASTSTGPKSRTSKSNLFVSDTGE